MVIRLEPLTRAHGPLLAPLSRDPAVLSFTPVPEQRPEDAVEWASGWAGRYAHGREQGVREGWAVFEGEEFVGVGMAPHIESDQGELELGYIVAPDARGRGLATAILRRLTEWAFARPEIHRVRLVIHVDNLASQAAARAAGYRLEGVMRSIRLKDGRIDAGLWSRLRDD